MASSGQIDRLAKATAGRWLGTVAGQIGGSAHFAQVDIDTLIPIRGTVKRELASFSVAVFEAVADDPVVQEQGWFLELSIPLDGSPVPLDPVPDSPVEAVLPHALFDGRLRGRAMPGLFLSTWIPSDRRGPACQRRVRLRWKDGESRVVHFREEGWTAHEGDVQIDEWTERALEFRSYPPEPIFTEASFP